MPLFGVALARVGEADMLEGHVSSSPSKGLREVSLRLHDKARQDSSRTTGRNVAGVGACVRGF
jgi:hypothetical protein